MKRRPFLQLLFALLVTLGLCPAAKPAWKVIWVDEEDEIFIVRDLAAYNQYFDRGGEPNLTEANRGEVWDYASENGLVMDEDGSAYTYREAFRIWKIAEQKWFQKSQACQIATGYA